MMFCAPLPAIDAALWRANPAADADLHSFLWKAHGEDVRVFKWTGKNDYVALCEPESISFGGGCVSPSRLVARRVLTSTFPFYYLRTALETGIMGSISMRRSTRARLRAARRLTTIRSAHPPAPARTVVAVAAPPRSSVSGSRCGVWRRREHEHDVDALLRHSRVLLRPGRPLMHARMHAAQIFFFFRYVSDQ